MNDGMSHLVKSTIAASFQILPCLSPSLLVDNEVCSLSGTISEVNVEEEDGVGGGIIDLTLEATNPCEV